MSAPIVVLLAVIVVSGAAALLVLSGKLRTEVDALLRSFDRTHRALVPVVVEVRSDRDRLAERLERLTDGADPDSTRR